MPKARIKSKLPIEIVVRADERHHTSVRKPRTHAYRRASEAPVSARAVAVIRPVPIIIALPLFLCTLSGKRQLHAYQYLSGGRPIFRIAGGSPSTWQRRKDRISGAITSDVLFGQHLGCTFVQLFGSSYFFEASE